MQIRHWLTLQASTQSLAFHSVRHLVGRPSRGVPVTNAINAISTASKASTTSTTNAAIPIKDKQKGEEQVLQLHVATEAVTDQ